MKKETNVKRTGCYIRRNRFILGAGMGPSSGLPFPLERWEQKKGWQMVDGSRALCG